MRELCRTRHIGHLFVLEVVVRDEVVEVCTVEHDDTKFVGIVQPVSISWLNAANIRASYMLMGGMSKVTCQYAGDVMPSGVCLAGAWPDRDSCPAADRGLRGSSVRNGRHAAPDQEPLGNARVPTPTPAGWRRSTTRRLTTRDREGSVAVHRPAVRVLSTRRCPSRRHADSTVESSASRARRARSPPPRPERPRTRRPSPP
jgi:hypothetical protein